MLTGADAVESDRRRWLARCELVLGWIGDPDGALTATLTALGAREIRLASPHASANRTCHQSDRFMELASDKGVRDDRRHSLRVAARLRTAAEALLAERGIYDARELTILHPGSGSSHKCCTPDLWALTLRRLVDHGGFPILVEGPADRRSVEQVVAAYGQPVPLFSDLDLSTMAGLLSWACLYIGHDSGLTHLAAAVGVPTIACFGPTEVRRWAPLGTGVTILTGEPCTCLSWQQVQACQVKPCLKIAPDTLWAACQHALDRREAYGRM